MIRTNGTAQSVLNTVFIVNETCANAVLCCALLIFSTWTNDVKRMAMCSLVDVVLFAMCSLVDGYTVFLIHLIHKTAFSFILCMQNFQPCTIYDGALVFLYVFVRKKHYVLNYKALYSVDSILACLFSFTRFQAHL